MDRRTVAVVLVVGLLVGAAPAVVALANLGTPIEGEVPVTTGQTPTITLVSTGGTTDVDMQTMWDGATLDIDTVEGNMTVTGDPGAAAHVAVGDIEGTQTQVTEIGAGASWLNLNPADKNRVDVRGDADALSFRSIQPDDGSTDLQLTGTQGGTAELRLYGLAASTDYTVYDASRDEVLGTFSTDASGDSGAFGVAMPDGSQALQVRTVGDYQDPTVSNPSPTGKVTTPPSELSVDATADAWPANVTFYLEGTRVESTNITSNGTVTASITADRLGAYDWSATITDAGGQTDSLSATFQTPRNLTIREETRPTEIVNSTTVTMRFFTADGDIAVQRSTDDGTINMSGLPNSEFALFVESPSHYDRQIYLDSIFDQTNVYLLNSTRFPRSNDSAIRSRFVYQDLTGDFTTSDTTIQIQRAIDLNDNGTSQYRTVAGGEWGASNEFGATLEFGERYRIVLVNRETGAVNRPGAHVPTADRENLIRVSGLVAEAANATGVTGLAEFNESGGRIDLAYHDAGNSTDELRVVVEQRGGDTEIYNQSVSGPLGAYSDVVSLNESQQEQDWVVVFDAGDRHQSAVPVGSGSVGLPVAVPPWLLTSMMALMVTFVGGLYGPRTALLGSWAMVCVVAGVAMFGWAFSGPSVIVAGLVAAAATFYARALP